MAAVHLKLGDVHIQDLWFLLATFLRGAMKSQFSEHPFAVRRQLLLFFQLPDDHQTHRSVGEPFCFPVLAFCLLTGFLFKTNQLSTSACTGVCIHKGGGAPRCTYS